MHVSFSVLRERSGRLLPSGPRIRGGLDHEALLVVLEKLTASSMVGCREWRFPRDFCYCPPDDPIFKEVYQAAIHIAGLSPREPQVLKYTVRVPQRLEQPFPDPQVSHRRGKGVDQREEVLWPEREDEMEKCEVGRHHLKHGRVRLEHFCAAGEPVNGME
jgi:hypothetical protein